MTNKASQSFVQGHYFDFWSMFLYFLTKMFCEDEGRMLVRMLLLPINMNCKTVTDGSVMRPPCSTLKLMVFTSKKCGECRRYPRDMDPPLLMLTTVFSVLSWSCHETTQHLGKNIWVNANKQDIWILIVPS